MAQITQADEMVGRTIEGAYVTSWIVVLNLGDGDYVCIEPEHDYGGGVELEVDEAPSPNELCNAGVISEEEYEESKAEQARVRDERTKTQELTLLKRLQQKYPEEVEDVQEA